MTVALAIERRVTIGERIRDARKAAGLTQVELAAALGVAHVQISCYERGKSWPNIEMLYKLCEALHKTPNDLLGY